MNIFNIFKKPDRKLPEIGELWNLKQESPFEPLSFREILEVKVDKHNNLWVKIKMFQNPPPGIPCGPDPIMQTEYKIKEFIKYFEFYKNKKDL